MIINVHGMPLSVVLTDIVSFRGYALVIIIWHAPDKPK